MPNILVLIDLRAGQPTRPSLFALSEGRRVARTAGATVFAVVPTPPLGAAEIEALGAVIGAAGADKLLLCEGDDLGGPPTDATSGRALDAAAARVPPLLVLLPAGGSGAAVGPPLAARLGGPFVPACDIVTSEIDVLPPGGLGRIHLVRLRPDGRSRRRIDPVDVERPVVAALGAGRRPAPSDGARNLEIDVLPTAPVSGQPTAGEIARTPDLESALELASVLVLIAADAVADPARLAADLTAADLPGTAIARAGEPWIRTLTGCLPDLVFLIGRSPATTGRSPRTQVVLVETAPAAGGARPPPDDVDIIWSVRSPAVLDSSTLLPLLRAVAGNGSTP